MITAVFSPHTDDAIFSIGAYIAAQQQYVVIVSPMAGVPDDEAGCAKHTRLREEHVNACGAISVHAHWCNGDFLDDVYPAPRRRDVKAWLLVVLADYKPDRVFIPFGIHHPDHLLVSNLLIGMIDTPPQRVNDGSIACMPDQIYFYEELPYRVDYPALAATRFAYLENTVGRLRMLEDITDDTLKRAAVEEYRSQITGGNVVERVMVRERIWELVR